MTLNMHHVLHYFYDNFQQFRSRSPYLCLTYNVLSADTLCNAVTLTFDILTLKVCGT